MSDSHNHRNQTTKQYRIDIRTTVSVKDTLTHAAYLSGVSMSAFTLRAAYEKAKTLIEEQEVILLSDNERDRFLTLLEKPAKPNAKLKQAMKKYNNKD